MQVGIAAQVSSRQDAGFIAAAERLSHQGRAYQLPQPGGQGRALRSMLAPSTVPGRDTPADQEPARITRDRT